MASNLRAADILGIDWESRARDMQPRETPAETGGVLAYWPGGTFRLEPAEVPRKNVLTDPDSWLNRGLSNLAGNVADVVLGRESGNSLVDLGAANVPGVGPAAILAAGGVPGLLDVAGAGELKNLARIPKYTLEFVSRHFGERGLRNLDNALTKLPKAGKPSVNDAVYIMRSGIGGEQVPAIVPYRSSDIMEDIRSVFTGNWSGMKNFDEVYRDFMDTELGRGPEGRYVAGLVEKARENDDVKSAFAAHLLIEASQGNPAEFEFTKKAISGMKDADYWHVLTQAANTTAEQFNDPVMRERMRSMKELSSSPVQDWDRLAEQQARREAKQVAKAEKKAAREAGVIPEPVRERTEELMREAPVAPRPEDVVPEAPTVSKPSEILGGPGKWRENGWSSKQYSPNFYEKFGRNMDEESKRDLFVLDSLANHWAGRLSKDLGAGDFSRTAIRTPLERADARHSLTNYDDISRGFTRDVLANIESGNMPGSAVSFRTKFKNNVPVEGKTTPTLILDISEKPRVIDNTRIWADEAEGPDLYEMLFRPKVDRKLNALNPQYWEY